MRMVVLAVAATMIAGAGSAVAQERTGYQAIAAGDLATAEATIAPSHLCPRRTEKKAISASSVL